jgi:hypothetical protein
MEMFVSQGRYDAISIDKLKESLGNIRLVELDTQVKRSKTLDKPIFLPMVGKDVVMINRDKAPFADIIAPFMLIQAKQQQRKNKKAINIYEELQKCSLLRSGDDDTRLLQGLVEVWRGKLQSDLHPLAKKRDNDDDEGEDSVARTNLNPQWSKAFPENLLHLVPEVDSVEYAIIKGNNIIIGKQKRRLPPLDGIKIAFILSTNLDKIKLQLSAQGGPFMTITADNLDDELAINVETLSESDRLAWTRFVEEEVREDILIKFLLTRSV